MQNVETEVKGNILIIKVDLSKEFGKSASGKSITIGSSAGPQGVDGHPGVSLNLNVYKAKK